MKQDIEKLKKLKVGDMVVCTHEWTYSCEAKITPGKRYSIDSIKKYKDGVIILFMNSDIEGQTLGLRIERDTTRFEFNDYFDFIPLKEIRKEKLIKINENGR